MITAATTNVSLAKNRPRRIRGGSRKLKALYWVFIFGLIGFNAWWYWRDTRPVPDLATINGWVRTQRYDEAERALREHLRRSSRDGEARMVLARLLAGRNDLRACALELDRVPEWWPEKAEARLRAGQAYFALNRAKDAEAEWKALINADALHPTPPKIFHDAATALLNIYATEERWDEALVIMWRVYDESPPSEHLPQLLLRIKSELERVGPAYAIIELRKYLAADPTDWEALRALSQCERQLGQHAEAMKHINECLSKRPEDPRAWRDYLSMLQQRGDTEELMAAVARIPRGAETEPEIWKFRALLREKASDWAGAASAYREAIARNPFVSEYHYRLGISEGRLGHRQTAKQELDRSTELKDARLQLKDAYVAVFDANEKPGPDSQRLRQALRRIGSICEALGWSRASEGFSRLAEGS